MKIYVEGGSRGPLATKCRQGFSEFFKNAGLVGHMPSVVSCGSRDETFRRFCTALNSSRSEAIPILLVDSEDPVRNYNGTWQHLLSRDGWERPEGARDEQAHLMVQCMETWFLADVSALKSFFGSEFRSAAIPQRTDIEDIHRDDVIKHLESASRNCRKNTYDKGSHSFDILSRLDSGKVIEFSPFAKRLIDTLKSHLIPE